MKSLRVRLFLGHLAISGLVIGLSVAFIVLVWYPGALARFEGVYDILLVMACVDVAAGPLCTLVAASPNKPRNELARDLTIIASVQLLALGYAVFTACVARPAFVVYSFGEFDVEHARQLSAEELAKASNSEFSAVPWLGPKFVAARLPDDRAAATRIFNSTISGGLALKDMPQYYLAWPTEATDARKRARPVVDLWEKGDLRPAAGQLLRGQGLAESDGLVLPIIGQARRGSVVLRKSDLAIVGIVVGFTP